MVLGLTGGVATGKSTVAALLARQGVHVIDCDEIARYITTYDTAALQAIELLFGVAVFHPAGALNRQALAAAAFSSEIKRVALEKLLHPIIGGVVHEGIRWGRETNRDVVAMIPLLFESGWQSILDRTWLVTCTEDLQVERAKSRGWSSPQTQARIRAQMPQAEKQRLADDIVDNSGSLDELEARVMGLWEGLKNRA